jgi:hypothetical protein
MAITYIRTLGLAKHVMLVEGNCVLAPQNCDMLIWVLGTVQTPRLFMFSEYAIVVVTNTKVFFMHYFLLT